MSEARKFLLQALRIYGVQIRVIKSRMQTSIDRSLRQHAADVPRKLYEVVSDFGERYCLCHACRLMDLLFRIGRPLLTGKPMPGVTR